LFRGIVENIQRDVRGAQWIGTVHVDQRTDNGLSRKELRAAAASGMRRISFGLESGSQRLLDAMDKGSTVDGNAEFIRHAHEAGLSVRATMFKGFPGETADDLNLSADFLDRHAPYIDRIRYNEFSLSPGTPVWRDLSESPGDYPGWRLAGLEHGGAQSRYVNREGRSASYRRAKARVLKAVFAINRKDIRSSARQFDGLM
jgi:anaerobic magnesium-protoporphyrin IX monomethyl ester cyclase